jgi:ATP-dependent Clp protease ATP-binding subunit ClpC
VLGRLGLTLEVARSDVVERVGSVPESDREATAALPSTPRTMDVLVVAWQEARSENDIGSEHILLALLREGQGVAAQVLSDRGISEEQVRSELRRG